MVGVWICVSTPRHVPEHLIRGGRSTRWCQGDGKESEMGGAGLQAGLSGEQSTGVLRAGRPGAPWGSAVPADRAAKLPMGLHRPGTRGAVNGEETDFGWVGGFKAASAKREASAGPTCWWAAKLSCCLSPAAGWEGAVAWRRRPGTCGSTGPLGLTPSPSASSDAFKHGDSTPGLG